jgi:multidrug efflux pump
MTLSELSVRRPVMAVVAAIILCVIGVAAYFTLPVRELPSVDPPQVSVGTNYRGASAEVVEERITEVIERQIAGLEGIDRITSNSRDGRSQINIAFALDRDIEAAANDVRDAVSRVVSQLPDEADPPQIAKAEADSQPIIFVQMSSTTMTGLQMADYADRYLVERFSTVPGVAQVNLFGAQLYSMRIWLNPDAMAARGITVSDVSNALRTQNVELPAGALESRDKDFTVRVNRRYITPADFQQLPIVPAGASGAASAAGSTSLIPSSNYVSRLGDIARVEEGADERRRLFLWNSKPLVTMALTRQAQSNDLEISQGVRKMVAEVNPTLPKGAKLEVNIDNSVFTEAAIHEVWLTMGLALVLVALVNLLFLGSWRSALIPSIVAPMSILGTFIVLAPLGFSLNLLTLLALVLAIGLVVDDAIVVVENIQRRIQNGEAPLVAADRGTKQVYFAVIATTAVLLAVFAPLMFMPGFIGRLFVELAVTVAAAIFFSAILALSLSPVLASKLLKPSAHDGFVSRRMDGAMARLGESYNASLQWMLAHKATGWITGGLVAVLALMAVGVYLKLPAELVPAEDRGQVQIQIQAPEGAGFDYTARVIDQMLPILAREHAKGDTIGYFLTAPMFGQFNQGFGNIVLKPWDQRDLSAQDLAADLNKQFSTITSARVFAASPAPLQRGGGGGGGGGGNSVQLIAQGSDYPEIQRWLQPILRAAETNPGLGRPRLNYEPTSPRLVVDIDREQAADLGISAQAVGDTLQTMFGSSQVTTYVRAGKEYDVILQTDRENRQSAEDLNRLYVRTASGELVPLASTVTSKVVGDTPARQRFDRQRSITLSAELQPGYTTAQAVQFFRDQIEANPFTPGVSGTGWGGLARDYLEGSGAVGLAFGMALLIVFLVLAAQFESFIHPAVIMLTVPIAALGGLFGLLMMGSSVNTYSQVGLIILVGIAAKNGILIVEFANQLRDEGRTVVEAVIEASTLRLRPIIMTSLTAAAVALPLLLASGPGSGSRRTIGAVIVSGSLFSAVLTLFIVPVFYSLLARFTKSPEATTRALEQYEAQDKGGEPGLVRPRAAE